MNRDATLPGASMPPRLSDYAWTDLPGRAGDLTAAGSHIPAHHHERTAGTFLMLEGEFINAGTTCGPGMFFTVAAGDVHGPHETETGCTLLFVQTVEVDPTDLRAAE